MKLMTKEIESRLEERGLDGQDGKCSDSKVIVKYFNPYGLGTWLITGGEKQNDGDWLLYGFVSLIYNEWGYILLSELQSLRLTNGMPAIERDRYLDKNATVSSECQRLGIRCIENG